MGEFRSVDVYGCFAMIDGAAPIPSNSGRADSFVARFYPESRIGGFSYSDGNVAFYSQVNAVLRPSDRILDFGAGRGGHIIDDVVAYRRELSNFRGRCAHVEGCDVDDAVLENPFVDHAEVISPGNPLPYLDNSFDLVLSRFVFEHVEDADQIATELLRVLKPGGIIAALTPNKYGYIAIFGSAVPNKLHARALRHIQPKRKAIDIFPTHYRLNTGRALKKAFGTAADVSVVYFSNEPSYFFGNSVLYRFWKWCHKYLPDRLRPVLIVFVRKL